MNNLGDQPELPGEPSLHQTRRASAPTPASRLIPATKPQRHTHMLPEMINKTVDRHAAKNTSHLEPWNAGRLKPGEPSRCAPPSGHGMEAVA